MFRTSIQLSPWLGIEDEKANTSIWDIYNAKAEQADGDLIANFNSSMDVLLVFVSLPWS